MTPTIRHSRNKVSYQKEDEKDQWLPEAQREVRRDEWVDHGRFFRAVKLFWMILKWRVHVILHFVKTHPNVQHKEGALK
jgi:hypothetical protein